MPSSLIALLAVAFQIGPFYQQKQDYCAVRPFVAVENEETDVLWPVFTYHRDWWRFCYLVNWQSHPEADGGLLLSDPELAIDWQVPAELRIISDKDKKHPLLKDFVSPFEI